MDTFFCGASFHEFSFYFPQAKAYRLLALQGKSFVQKSAILQDVCRRLRQEHLPFIRILKGGQPAQAVGILLPVRSAMVLDYDYFAGISEEYPRAPEISFSADAPALTQLAKSDCEAFTEYDALLSETNRRAQSFREAAASLRAENRQLLIPCINKAAVLRFILRFLQKKNGRIACRQNTGATVEHRVISGITGWGIQTLYTPFAAREIETIVLKDNIGAVSETLLNGLAEVCVQNGLCVQLFHCGLTGVAEHCVIPALSAAFFTANLSHPFPLRSKGVVSASRFVRLSAFSEILPEVRFNATAADEMLEEAVFSQLEVDELSAAREQILQSFSAPQHQSGISEQIYKILVKTNSQFDENHFENR